MSSNNIDNLASAAMTLMTLLNDSEQEEDIPRKVATHGAHGAHGQASHIQLPSLNVLISSLPPLNGSQKSSAGAAKLPFNNYTFSPRSHYDPYPQQNDIYNTKQGFYHQKSASLDSGYSPSYEANITTKTRKRNPEAEAKFDHLKDGSVTARVCGDCQATSTSGHWCQDNCVVNGYICQKCYRRRKRDEVRPHTGSAIYRSISQKKCLDCSRSNTKVWFRHYSVSTGFLCFECNDGLQAHLKTEVRCCDRCGAIKTSFCENGKGRLLCKTCSSDF